jgi:hypothetical protein
VAQYKQHQHHVDERRDVDLVHFIKRVLAVIKTHADDPLDPTLAGSLGRRQRAGAGDLCSERRDGGAQVYMPYGLFVPDVGTSDRP